MNSIFMKVFAVFVTVVMLGITPAQATTIAPLHGGFYSSAEQQEYSSGFYKFPTYVVASFIELLLSKNPRVTYRTSMYETPADVPGTTLRFNEESCGRDIDSDGVWCDTQEPYGENSINCCYDCEPGGGMYCDNGPPGSLRPLNEINLVYESPAVISPVSICESDDSFDVVVRLENSPWGVNIRDPPGLRYILKGQTYPTTCDGPDVSDRYTCTITVPQDPTTCEGTGETITGTVLQFPIAFPDGIRIPKTRDLTAPIPDISVAAFIRGDGSCDEELGENYENSCYDCSCPAGQYCDAPAGTSPSDPSWSCRNEPTNVNVVTTPLVPSSFDEYSPGGNQAEFNYRVTNFPVGHTGASIPTQNCTVVSCAHNQGSCTGQCSVVTCNEVQGSGDEISKDCTISVTINNYNSELSYSLTPQINIEVRLNDGPRPIVRGLSRSLGPLLFGSSFCGDGIVNSTETSQNCCFDADCNPNEYCSGDPTGPPHTFQCVPLPTSSANLHVTALDPSFFPVYEYSGVLSDFVYRITEFPVGRPGFLVTEEQCETSCATSGGSCEANCFVDVCTDTSEPGGNMLTKECTLRFVINPNDYDQTKDYILAPTFTATVNVIDGQEPVEIELSKFLDSVTIGAFFCGDGTQQEMETASNCCWDAGCEELGEEYYCDGDPEDSRAEYQCRQLPSDFNLFFERVRPSSFSDHSAAGNAVNVEYRISSFPSDPNTAVSGETCGIYDCESIDPETGNDNFCTATCEVDSCEPGRMEGGAYKRDCRIRITVDPHTSTLNYNVIPEFGVEVSNIADGPRDPMSATLSSVLPTINFGSWFCGDGTININEDQTTCCYDVECDEGYYCDTKTAGTHTRGDSCKPLSGVTMYVTLSRSTFTDSSIEHRTTVDIVITNPPGGMDVNLENARCDLGDGEVTCDLEDCDEESFTSTEYRGTCRLRIPPIDFETSPLFNEAQGALVFSGELELPVIFNDGPGQEGKDLEDDFGPITVIVQTECPDGTCDFDEETGQANACPADCGCPEGQFLVVENEADRGKCLAEENIGLTITGVNPAPLPCIVTLDNVDINQFRGQGKLQQVLLAQQIECTPDPLTVTARIDSAPRNLEVVDARYVADGEMFDVSCTKKQDQTYTCPMTLRGTSNFNIFGPLLGVVMKNIELQLTTEYTSKDSRTGADVLLTREVSDSTELMMTYELAQDVAALKTCYEELTDINSEIDELEDKKDSLMRIVLVMVGIVVAAWITCKLSTAGGAVNTIACNVAVHGTPLTACIAAPLLWSVGSTMDDINDLKDDRQDACAATGLSGIEGAGSSTGSTVAKIFSGVSAIVCIVGIMKFDAIIKWAPKDATILGDGKFLGFIGKGTAAK